MNNINKVLCLRKLLGYGYNADEVRLYLTNHRESARYCKSLIKLYSHQCNIKGISLLAFNVLFNVAD